MFRALLNQSASYRPSTGTDTHGDTELGNAVTVRCRVEHEVKLVRTKDGELYESHTQYWIDRQPTQDGEIDGLRIVAIGDNPGLGGVTTVWEAYC